MHRVPSQANQQPPHMILDQPASQPRVGRVQEAFLPTTRTTRSHTTLQRRQTTPHAHTEEKHRQSTSQPTPAAPSAENKESPRRPPSTLLPTETDPQDTSLNQHPQSAASAPCTRPQIFNQRPDSQPSTLRSTKCTQREASHSVAIPIEYPQEKALLLLPPPPLNKCPPHPHLSITFTPRLSVVEEELKN